MTKKKDEKVREIITADALGEKVCEALNIDAGQVARLVIDLPAGEVAHVYVEMHGTAGMLDVNWDSLVGAVLIEVGGGEVPKPSVTPGVAVG